MPAVPAAAVDRREAAPPARPRVARAGSTAALASAVVLAAALGGCATVTTAPAPGPAPASRGPADCASPSLVSRLLAQRQRLFLAMERGDRPVLEELLTDRFVFVHASGASESRQAFIDHAVRNAQTSGARAGRAIEFLEDDLRVRSDGSIAWTGRSATHPKGEPTIYFRTTDVLVEQAGRWRWVSVHSTRATGAAAAPLAGPPQGCAVRPPASVSNG